MQFLVVGRDSKQCKVLGREEMENPWSVNNLKTFHKNSFCAKYTEKTMRKQHKHDTNVIFRGLGEGDTWKNLKRKISRHNHLKCSSWFPKSLVKFVGEGQNCGKVQKIYLLSFRFSLANLWQRVAIIAFPPPLDVTWLTQGTRNSGEQQ